MSQLSELDFVVVDLETTGLYVERGDRIIEMGAVKMKGEKVCEDQTFHTLVNIDVPLTAEATAIHGIKQEDLVGQPSLKEASAKLEEFISGSIPVAQNARFDLGFLRNAALVSGCHRLVVPFLDTMLISKLVLFHYTSGHNLDAIAKRLKIESKWDRHRSIGDCMLTAHILSAMIRELRALGKSTLKDMETCFVSVPRLTTGPTSTQTLALF